MHRFSQCLLSNRGTEAVEKVRMSSCVWFFSHLISVFFIPVGRNYHSTWHHDPYHASRGTHYPCNETWYAHTRALRTLNVTHTYTHVYLRSNAWCHWAPWGPLYFEVCWLQESHRKLCLTENKLSQLEDVSLPASLSLSLFLSIFFSLSPSLWEYDFTALGQRLSGQ